VKIKKRHSPRNFEKYGILYKVGCLVTSYRGKRPEISNLLMIQRSKYLLLSDDASLLNKWLKLLWPGCVSKMEANIHRKPAADRLTEGHALTLKTPAAVTSWIQPQV